MSDAPRVLVLGGCGFIGRNFVKYLVDNALCSKITVADKAMPITSCFTQSYTDAFASDVVQFVQADLNRDAHVSKVFGSDLGFDLVFNLAAETRYGMPEDAYKARVLGVSSKCAAAAAALRNEDGSQLVKRFVEVSTSQVYKSSGKNPASEDPGVKGSELGPWTLQARYSLEAEVACQSIAAKDGLQLVRLRPAIVYGPADTNGLMPRVVCAAAYHKLGLNTVHVRDVCRAMWHTATSDTVPAGVDTVFNLADTSDTDQGMLGSNVAKLKLQSVASMSNEKHMKPFGVLCRESGILNTPLSPFLDKELLAHNHTFVDGTAICATGFVYECPKLTLELLREEVELAIAAGHFPPILATQKKA